MNIEQKVSAAYHLQVCEGDRIIHDTGEFANLITDYALTLTNPFSSGFICVGDDDTKPNYQDISLGNELKAVSASFNQSSAEIIMRGDKRYSRIRCYAEITGVAGTIKEIGFKRLNNQTTLISRTLVRDGKGQQTQIPLRNEQTLKINYYVYILIPYLMASGEIIGPYGRYPYEIRPYDGMTQPRGLFAGNFASPLNGTRLAIVLRTSGNKTAAATTNWTQIAAEQKTTAVVYFDAINNNRTISRIEASSGQKNYFAIYFTGENLFNPAESDIGFTLTITWGREQ